MRENLRVSLILLRYRILQLLATSRAKTAKKKAGQRGPKAPKPRMSSLTLIVLYGFFALSLIFGQFNVLFNMTQKSRIQQKIIEWNAGDLFATPSPIWANLPNIYWLGLSVTLLVMLIGSILIPMARVNHSTRDNDLEWISTFPVSLSSFHSGRALQWIVLNPFNWIFLIPMLVFLVLFRGTGLGYNLPLVGLMCLCFTLIASSIGVWLDGVVQTCFSPSRQRDVRALALLVTSVLLVQVYLGFQSQQEWFWRWIMEHRGPLSRSVWQQSLNQLLAPEFPGFKPYILLIACTAGVGWMALIGLERLFRNGIVKHSGYERQSVKKIGKPIAMSLLDRIPVMVRREWQLLVRDRTHLIQTLAPIVSYGLIHLLNRSSQGSDLFLSMRLTILMMMPLLMISTSSVTMMQKEKSSLWQYATAPQRLTAILGDRQTFWFVMALALWLGGSTVFLQAKDFADPLIYARLLLMPLALWMFQNLALTVVLFFHDPFNDDSGKRPSMRLTYLLMSISGVLLWAVVHAQPWNGLVALTLFFGVTLAMRQRMKAYEPFILDPSASPPATADLGDGLIAALIYFVLQIVIMAVGGLLGIFSSESAVMWASLLAAVLTFAAMMFHYYRQQTLEVPRYWGRVNLKDVGGALMALTLLNEAARFWTVHAGTWTFWKWIMTIPDAPQEAIKPSLFLYLFAGLIAPLIEEFIFRGLIFGGLKRRMRMGPALLLSSVIFAFVHPPFSFGPVFLLGLATAWLFHRTRVLLPSVLLHIAYNLLVLSRVH